MDLPANNPARKHSTPPLDIRPATLDEMSMVADFVSSSAEWYRPIVDEKDMGEHAVDEAWASRNFELRDFYIGRADENAIGTISLQYFDDYAYLGYIYLNVDYVGNGYGRTLIDFAQGVARRRGVKGMSLIAHPEATWAKKAYLKYGFEIVERNKDKILSWQDGALVPYYEEGFELYLYDFDRPSRRASRRAQRPSPETSVEAQP
jgi:ribosomal protein S18 acetylase RimI-like enzyme